MLQTPIGELIVLLNGEKHPYHVDGLPLENVSYRVDGRVRIRFQQEINLRPGTILEYMIKGTQANSLRSSAETGEGLQLISIYNQKHKLSIGLSETCDIKYTYLPTGIRVDLVNKVEADEIEAFIAWADKRNPGYQGNYTWFAADPTLGE